MTTLLSVTMIGKDQPSKPSPKARRRLQIKNEDEGIIINHEVIVTIPQPPSQVNMDIDLLKETFNEVAKPDWIRKKNAPSRRPTWVRNEGKDYFDSDGQYETYKEYDSDGDLTSPKSHYEPSYFDTVQRRADDDDQPPFKQNGHKRGYGLTSISSGRTHRYQTRQASRRTRGECKRYKKNQSNSARLTTSKSIRSSRDPVNGIARKDTIKSAIVKGLSYRRSIPPECWKIDRDIAVRTIRSTSQRYHRKLIPSMKQNISTGD